MKAAKTQNGNMSIIIIKNEIANNYFSKNKFRNMTFLDLGRVVSLFWVVHKKYFKGIFSAYQKNKSYACGDANIWISSMYRDLL